MPARQAPAGKPVIYQVFPRVFGNRISTNKPWGTIEENGVGKFDDFTDRALEGIREFGVSHIWYTGIPHHAVIRDYTEYGISNDDPDVVKGRAGSPYAVKDYYNVDPDLAVDPANSLEEFRALVERTHQHGIGILAWFFYLFCVDCPCRGIHSDVSQASRTCPPHCICVLTDCLTRCSRRN